MTHDEILQAVREVVTANLSRPVSDTQALVSSGLLDSLMILRLIGEIEKKLNVRLQTDAIQPDDFDTLELAAETVERTAAAE